MLKLYLKNNTQKIELFFDDTLREYKFFLQRRNEKKLILVPRRVRIANTYILTKEQEEEIDNLFIANYGKRIDYIWHKYYAAHAGHFDSRFIPELLYGPEFEQFQNQNISAVRMMEDKNFLPVVAKSAGIKMPQTIISCTNGILRDGERKIITESMALELLTRFGVFFVKPSVDSCSGQGCRKLQSSDKYVFSNNTLVVNDEVVYKQDFVVQEIVACHESIRHIYPESVNSFRVISYLWHDKVELMPLIIRIGQGGKYVDNAHAGGIFCAVNNDGTMGDHAMTEFNDWFKDHPDTHTVFANHKIEYVDRVIEAAKKMHAEIPQIGVVNWDFTIDEAGTPVLIEANVTGGSVWLPQMAHGVGGFGEKTAEVLQWLRFMKKLKPHDRIFYMNGRIG